jgi:hypothetical protein
MFEDGEGKNADFDLRRSALKKRQADFPDDHRDHDDDEDDGPVHELDTPEMHALHARLMAIISYELDRQQVNRMEQVLDEAFYDGEQYTAEDIQALRDRGQEPLVFNVIATSINWILGTERRARVDFKILPRRKEDGKAAENKTKLMKYLADVNRTEFSFSEAFSDAAKVGIGWMECGFQDDADGEQVYERHESWRNMLYDSAGTQKDCRDWRYIARLKWVDEDIITAIFPDREQTIKQSVNIHDGSATDAYGDEASDEQHDRLDSPIFARGGDFNYSRRTLRVMEIWYRKPMKTIRLSGGQFSGQIYDETFPPHAEAVETGESRLKEGTVMRVMVAIMTVKGLLYASESPFRHNEFPFTPVFGIRRGSDGLPYGLIRGLRDLNRDINKRASKALYILSTNKALVAKGSVGNLDDFAEEVSRPDAVIEYDHTKPAPILNVDRELASAHMEFMSRSIQMIQQVSGITDEAMGRTTNASSGIAIGRRQEQGQLATAIYFDNLRLARQLHGEKKLSSIEQFYDERKIFRITNSRGTPDYVTINDGLPENDIVRAKADFIISESDWQSTIRQAQTQELLELLTQLAPVNPQLALVMLDLVVESMDVPSREELVNRIRQISGMRDPDAEEPTPEEIERQQQAAEQAAMQKAAMQAEIAGKQADAEYKGAMARKTLAQVDDVAAGITSKNVASQKAAIETAHLIAANPLAVSIADETLHESGFRSRSEKEDDDMMETAKGMEAQREQEEAAAIQQQEMEAAQAEEDARRQEAQREAVDTGQTPAVIPNQPGMKTRPQTMGITRNSNG